MVNKSNKIQTVYTDRCRFVPTERIINSFKTISYPIIVFFLAWFKKTIPDKIILLIIDLLPQIMIMSFVFYFTCSTIRFRLNEITFYIFYTGIIKQSFQ